MEADPNDADAHDTLSGFYQDKGEYEKAVQEEVKALLLRGDGDAAEVLRRGYAKGGFSGYLKADISVFGDRKRKSVYDPYEVARDYSVLGDKDNAFLWLDRAYDYKAMGDPMLDVLINAELDNVRSDPRFAALLRRMGFPQSAIEIASRPIVRTK